MKVASGSLPVISLPRRSKIRYTIPALRTDGDRDMPLNTQITQLDFLRHGEPVGGAGRYRGQIDDPLSELGWRQMRQATQSIRPWTRIVSSPLVRCLDFARELAQSMGLSLTVDCRLKEVGFGAWEGRSKAEIQALDPEALRLFRADPIGQRPVGAEELSAFIARVGAACDDMVRDLEGQRVLIVSHAGVMRAVFAHALELPMRQLYHIHVGHAEFSRYRHAEGRFTLLAHGLNHL